MARPPLATERLERLADGRIADRLRHPWRDGTTGLIFEPREFIARLATLIPPPRANQLRYHGILAPAAAWLDKVVPDPESEPEDSPAVPRKHLPSWATLLKRVFALDALRCSRCGGRTRVLAAITYVHVIARSHRLMAFAQVDRAFGVALEIHAAALSLHGRRGEHLAGNLVDEHAPSCFHAEQLRTW